jgi:hypothetical protein
MSDASNLNTMGIVTIHMQSNLMVESGVRQSFIGHRCIQLIKSHTRTRWMEFLIRTTKNMEWPTYGFVDLSTAEASDH